MKETPHSKVATVFQANQRENSLTEVAESQSIFPLKLCDLCERFRLLISIFFLASATSCFAATPDETFLNANSAFVSGKYSEAIQSYQSLLDQKIYSPALFYNLANAYFRDGKIGLAILNYEKALTLAPGDADIKANLHFVRQSVTPFESSVNWGQVIPFILRFNSWAWLLSFFVILLCLSMSLRILNLDKKWSLRPLIFLFSIGIIISIAAIIVHIGALNRAVILEVDASLKIAPVKDSPSLGNLPVGSIVTIENQREGFCYVNSLDGKKGWLTKEQVQKIYE